ncbi:unnamed protein product [Staurois parvus]|uniref:MORN repeat-containing protein 5 n=1 Tax=Staurois parvus TaxID=386267 RepID=A0ABN9HJV8_9NEOB|nr:unnamed protein product [Staurois parvus]
MGTCYVKGAHTVERGSLMGTCDGKRHSDGEYYVKGTLMGKYDGKGYFEWMEIPDGYT